MNFIGRNVNTNDVANVKAPIELNGTTATLIDAPNLERMYFSVSIAPAASTVCCFIRLYPAATDNIMRGIWIGRFNSGNDVFFKSEWAMPSDNIYTGEISAILMSGDPNTEVYITTY